MLNDRFWDKVEKTDSCWNWKAAKYPNGYGGYGSYEKGKTQLVHRLVYEEFKGKIPKGLTIDHLCRNRACVNPDHLDAVTNRENVLRGIGLTAQNSKKTQCPQGHQYTEKNTYYYPSANSRSCKICRKNHNQKYLLNKKIKLEIKI